MFKLNEAAVIKKQIGSIGASGARIVKGIQSVATQTLAHAVKHGDITLAQELVNAVPKHFKASLVAWLELYGPFRYNNDSKALVFHKGCKALKEAGIVPGAGEVTQDYVDSLPLWDGARKATEPRSQYDASEECSKFFARMQKLASDGNVTMKNKALLREVVAFYNRKVADLDETNVSPEGSVLDPVHGEVIIPSLKDASQLAA